MSRENVEIVREAYAALRSHDVEYFISLLDPDVEFQSLIMEAEGRVYRGPDGVREYLSTLLEVLPDWQPTEERIDDYGDTLVVKARVRGSGAGSGAVGEQVMWQVVRLVEGKPRSWEFFRTQSEALEAAGLSE